MAKLDSMLVSAACTSRKASRGWVRARSAGDAAQFQLPHLDVDSAFEADGEAAAGAR